LAELEKIMLTSPTYPIQVLWIPLIWTDIFIINLTFVILSVSLNTSSNIGVACPIALLSQIRRNTFRFIHDSLKLRMTQAWRILLFTALHKNRRKTIDKYTVRPVFICENIADQWIYLVATLDGYNCHSNSTSFLASWTSTADVTVSLLTRSPAADVFSLHRLALRKLVRG
jgi:hypothetical protein